MAAALIIGPPKRSPHLWEQPCMTWDLPAWFDFLLPHGRSNLELSKHPDLHASWVTGSLEPSIRSMLFKHEILMPSVQIAAQVAPTETHSRLILPIRNLTRTCRNTDQNVAIRFYGTCGKSKVRMKMSARALGEESVDIGPVPPLGLAA